MGGAGRCNYKGGMIYSNQVTSAKKLITDQVLNTVKF